MPDKKKHPRRNNAQASPADAYARIREYNYILRLSRADISILDKYREVLIAGAADFAEAFYNYLFDNPDIARMLYEYESNGGDVGKLARSELKQLLHCLFTAEGCQHEQALLAAGRKHRDYGFRPVWVIGGYNLLQEYLSRKLPDMIHEEADRNSIGLLLSRVILRNLGLTLEGYWSHAGPAGSSTHAGAPRQQQTEGLLESIPLLVWSVDIANMSVVYANRALRDICAYSPDGPFPMLEIVHEPDRQLLLDAWQDVVRGDSRQAEVRLVKDGGYPHWYRLALYPETEGSGKTVRVHCVLEDIHLQISERQQLQQMATTDPLTGLPNRALWIDHLNMALAASRRVPGSQVVLIAVDINQFRMYNDTLGHQAGDILLRDVADRLDSLVRESDSLARLGGDQFGILLQPANNTREAAERVITKILDVFDIPFSFRDKQLCISLSLGVACFPEDGNNADTLLNNAESAMQRAKRSGLQYQYYDPVNDISSVQQLRYSGQLRNAIHNGELALYYQPQMELESRRICGAEALLRWEHPQEGTVMPRRVIPLAEQLGLITPITDWVLANALRQCRQWRYEGNDVPVSINVSARSFQSPRLLEKISQALQEAGVSGDCLEIEITEATLMMDIGRAAEVLTTLGDMGVRVAIDDFGTGYSSLSYLKRLPIHTLKIDHSFVTDLAFDQQDVAIVRSIIDLGHNLGCKVVAEGVESVATLRLLSQLGCDSAQGFHICQPLPEQQLSRLFISGPDNIA